MILVLGFNALLVAYVKAQYDNYSRRCCIDQARQLADNLTAGEIAGRIAVGHNSVIQFGGGGSSIFVEYSVNRDTS